jgi:hypothetical protein
MSGLSISFGRLPADDSLAASAADRGTHGALLHAGRGTAAEPDRLPTTPRHGCVVTRRITDDRGREWRVRQLWSEHCHGLLFQCTVRGVRSEVRPMHAPLESLTDADLVSALAPADD